MSSFDPSTILEFSVIKCPVTLEGIVQEKRFVIISHKEGHAICLKASSKVARYLADSELLNGVVFYKAAEVSSFEKDTVIQPDNQFPIAHSDLLRHHQSRQLTILGEMPPDFREKLLAATDQSSTMSERTKGRLRSAL